MKEGWEYKKLGEVCEILDSQRKPITKGKREPGAIPYYGATGCLDYVKDYIFDEKLVLLGEDGAKWGAGDNSAYIINGKSWVNNHAHALRPKRDLLIDELLVYYLNFSNLLPYITGVTVPKLNQEKMRSIEIPIGPLKEQQSIVDYLDSAFAKIDAMKANAEKALGEAKALFQASLKEMLEPKEGWEEKALGEVCKKLFSGGDAPKDNMAKVPNEEYNIPIYANAAELDGLYGYTNYYRVNEPSVTIAARGSGTGLVLKRKGAYLPIVRLIVAIPQSFLSVDYLYFALQIIGIKSNGSAIPQLTVPAIKQYRICYPPKYTEQQSIVATLDSLKSKVDRLQENYDKISQECDALKQAILRQVFE